MRRQSYSLKIFVLASILAFAPLGLSISNWQQVAVADDAADALNKCDVLASDPHDPDRNAAGVTNEQMVPRQAIEACKSAVDLNPDVARAWFELGRAYWIGERDKEAFAALGEAAKQGYAPASKYLDDVAAYLKGKAAEAAKDEFDPSIFQNPTFMTRLYNYNGPRVLRDPLILYLTGFTDKIGGPEPFFVSGQRCLPQISAQSTSILVQLGVQIGQSYMLEPQKLTNMVTLYTDQGGRDAIALFNRHGCDSAITRRIISNVNALAVYLNGG